MMEVMVEGCDGVERAIGLTIYVDDIKGPDYLLIATNQETVDELERARQG